MDQKWRYEHLKNVNPIKGKVIHHVRARNGKWLSKIELAKKFPNFIHVELVDIGERFTFYEPFVKGSATALVTPKSPTKLSLVGDFVQTQDDLLVLRNLWSRVGSYTEHQSPFSEFNLGE